MTGVERIRLAAAEFRDPDAIEGCKKIMLAAQECVDPTAIPGVMKIRLAARDGEKLSEADAGVRKIRAAAGMPVDETESLAKAMTMARDMDALDGLLARVQLPRKSARPVRRTPPARPPRPQPVQTPDRGAVRGVEPVPVRGSEPAPLPPDHPLAYWDFRDRMAGDIRANRVHPSADGIVRHAAASYGIGMAEAAEWTERFLGHIQRELPGPARVG